MKIRTAAAAAAASLLCFGACASGRKDGKSYSIAFNADAYEERSVTVNGETTEYRAYENIVYVRNPADVKYESMNIYIPSAYFEGGSVNGWTAETAPVFFPNQVGGYMPGLPGTVNDGTQKSAVPGPAFDGGQSGPNASAVALHNGLVVASPGARGRTEKNGRAPSCIVDLKAAVRYLRYNDRAMPGDAEKIISNGTSAGGALSALLGATGNSSDYEPYLKAVGAADERDDIYAVSAYCPITNLDNADAAYEWLFNGHNDYSKFDISMLDYKVERKEVKGTLDASQQKVSADLKALFPSYVNSLGLTAENGVPLALDKDGNGTFRDYVKSFITASAEKALESGTDMTKYPFVTVKDGKVSDIDFDAYVAYAGRQKLPPAFDALDLDSGEANLFGTETEDARHFTAYGEKNNTAPGAESADPEIVRMMNPMNYIGNKNAQTSKYWRIRQGTKDRDTSAAIPVILARTLSMKGYSVDFEMPWDRPHSGDYDLGGLFAWIGSVCRPEAKI